MGLRKDQPPLYPLEVGPEEFSQMQGKNESLEAVRKATDSQASMAGIKIVMAERSK